MDRREAIVTVSSGTSDTPVEDEMSCKMVLLLDLRDVVEKGERATFLETDNLVKEGD
jgi:hypothetical protein